jgi:hypothetical protein
MIYYLSTRRHFYTIGMHLQALGTELARRIKLISYERISLMSRLERGAYIFADLDRCTPGQMEIAKWTADRIRGSCQILNDPAKVVQREKLLRILHQRGNNPFAVYRVGDDLSGVRFPAFVRDADEHEGSASELLHSQEELTAAIEAACRKGIARSDLLVVEYCDTADINGIFRKYSVFRIGEKFLARHVIFSRKWVLKYADIAEPWAVEEEERYILSNPHEKQIADIFQLAHTDYGRIDYGLKDGKVVTWEINLNPTVMPPLYRVALPRMIPQTRFGRMYNEAMESLDTVEPGPAIDLEIPSSLRQKAGVKIRHRIAFAGGTVLQYFSKKWPWRRMLHVVQD